MDDKRILDVTCGSRGIWFDKENPYTIYADKRIFQAEGVFGKRQAKDTINVNPDIIADFENLPFDDNTFSLVVFDPPHLVGKDESWLKKKYGYYESIEQAINSVSKGIHECMRVLKSNGVLIFKWSEIKIPTKDIISKCGYMPLFGHKSGKKMNTHWLTFMKLPLENSQMSLFDEIDTMPAANQKPIIHAKWEDMQYDETLEYWTAICSNCGSISSDSFPIIGSHLFCERCGADMHEPIKG